MMKAADQSLSLWDQALKSGFEKGFSWGLEFGRPDGAIDAIRRLLFDIARERGWRVPATQKRRVETCRDPERLAAWVKRVVTARSLTEALAG